MIERAFGVSLTIPDNEAYTALVTLQRLGIACSEAMRADVYVFGVDDEAAADALERLLPTIATIFNPNKHRLRALRAPRPQAGEVWISAAEAGPPADKLTVGGVLLPRARTVWRATSWRLRDAQGADVAPALLRRAVETLLCNPAFQRALYEDRMALGC
ncbi:MAG: hypothetical protein JOY59_13260 [Candidatus Eremiobacteraeota bacterium]|nr:hypothetical protein [Candidatus Eremiobacteraeota bacterium]